MARLEQQKTTKGAFFTLVSKSIAVFERISFRLLSGPKANIFETSGSLSIFFAAALMNYEWEYGWGAFVCVLNFSFSFYAFSGLSFLHTHTLYYQDHGTRHERMDGMGDEGLYTPFFASVWGINPHLE